jgi:hypothetical protein
MYLHYHKNIESAHGDNTPIGIILLINLPGEKELKRIIKEQKEKRLPA